ncbi:MAG: SUMF1/EgtB/PvdO family nonheme iron enzyme [Treponema sp.]|nr:SUMF1/EgtB/PvdO family nonheme iron enzyme [Treponema sp.]
MKNKSADTSSSIENEDKVKLKPIMGMRPGVYLTVIYSFILLLVLFFLFVFPGLINPGSVIIAKTEPAGAAVRVNDVYMGVAGSRIFLPNGTYTIEAVMPGFEKQAAVHTVKGRVLGSLMFPRQEKLEFTFKTSDPKASLAVYAADFSEWTFGGEPTSAWQIPLSLSEGAYRIGPYADTAKEELNEILKAASRFTVTRAALRDLIRAKALLDNMGNAPSPSALLSSISDVIAFVSENPVNAQWILSLMPKSPSAAAVESSQWYKSSVYTPEIIHGSTFRFDFAVEIMGLGFTNIPPSSITLSGSPSSALSRIDTGEFYIGNTAVSKSLFKTFLEENPQWSEHQTDYYPQDLSVNPMDSFNRDAVTGITWYAADAFCKWLTGFLPPFLNNMEVRLPTENEWSAASLVINNMSGPGWIWCADLYVPLPYITAEPEAIKAVGSPERSLRGRQSLTSAETRASLPPDFSSPYVTIRPVIAAAQPLKENKHE